MPTEQQQMGVAKVWTDEFFGGCDKVSLLEGVKIQAQVLVPVIRALRREIGTERANQIVSAALRSERFTKRLASKFRVAQSRSLMPQRTRGCRRSALMSISISSARLRKIGTSTSPAAAMPISSGSLVSPKSARCYCVSRTSTWQKC
jgi:hypothetical protein